MRKPFYRKSRKCWYVKDQAGNFVRLHPEKSKAEDLWEEMLASGCDRGRLATVLGVTEAFLTEHEALVSPEAFYNLRNYVLSFADSVPSNTLVSKVTKGMVVSWLKEEKPGRLLKNKDPKDKTERRGPSKVWSAHGQRDAGAAVKRVFRWARDQGMIDRNPLAGLKLETPEPRQEIIDPTVHARLIQACMASNKSRSFALYLIASHCGARPQQIRDVTAQHVSGGVVWRFVHHKTAKKTKKPLDVYLSPCLQTLTRILVAARPHGPLFLNDSSKPWKKDTVCQRMERLRESLSLDSSVIAYAYRHTFVTDALLAGNNVAVVAALAGHTSTAMVQQVYNHLDKHPEHLLNAAAKTSSNRISESIGKKSPR
jgi:integrase